MKILRRQEVAENSKVVGIRCDVMFSLFCFAVSLVRSNQPFYNVRMLNKNDEIHPFQFGHLLVQSKRRRIGILPWFFFPFFFFSIFQKLLYLIQFIAILVPLFCGSFQKNCPMNKTFNEM